jgi:hypothetical protein
MSPTILPLGARQIDYKLPNAGELLLQNRNDTGCYYLDYQPITPSGQAVLEDLPVKLLVKSQAGWRAFLSIMEHDKTIDLAQLPGFAASVVNKVLIPSEK